MGDILASFVNLVPVTLAQSLAYGFIALGIMIPFRVLNFPDLASEGTFPLGACLCAALLAAGASPVLATLVAMLAGFAAGCATAFIHLRFRINTLLAGILVLTMLWSIDLRIMGKSNTPLFAYPTVFSLLSPSLAQSVALQIGFWALATVLALGTAWWLLRTEAGLALRAVGANEVMARAQGIDVWRATLVGVGAANALNAFSGAVVAQAQGFADVGMGFGVLINGLAALIIGEALTGRETVARQILAPLVGSIVYYQVVSLGLAVGIHPSDLKFATAAFVLLTLALPLARGAGLREARLRE